MFLGWYDAEKKKPARRKVAEAVERYIEKFGAAPATCLTSLAEAEELAADKKAPDLTIQGVSYIPRYTFYVGESDEPEELLADAA